VAVAAIGCEGSVKLTGWRSVEKSYPGFWKDFERSPGKTEE
jgi:5-enolpyruvylshikimate-3-phosphate synthase